VAVSFLFHFPSAFAAWDFPSVLPFGVRTFLGAARATPRSPGLHFRLYSRTRGHFGPEHAATLGTRNRPSRAVLHELAADEALEARSTKECEELLLERAVEGGYVSHCVKPF
jgi:hypothetical protein